MIYSEEALKALNFAYANLLWISRGAKRDNDLDRMNADFLDARRIVGFLAADKLLEGFNNGDHTDIPPYYFDYLNCFSIDEYKQVKAFLIWEKRGAVVNDDQTRILQDFLDACASIPDQQSQRRRNLRKPCESLLEHLREVNKENIKRRKAYWSHLRHCNKKHDNWKDANNFVEIFYNQAITALVHGHQRIEADFFRLVSDNHHLANMFELFLLFHLEPKTGQP